MIKNLPANAGDLGLIPGWGRPPGEGKDNPFQYSCLENPMDKGAWQATVHGVEELDMTELTCTHMTSLVIVYAHLYLTLWPYGVKLLKALLRCGFYLIIRQYLS